MEYTTDEDGLRWKLRQIDYELTCTLPTYRKANRLAELGFVVGAQVKVVSEMGGNLILSVKDSRIALDRTMAMRIMV